MIFSESSDGKNGNVLKESHDATLSCLFHLDRVSDSVTRSKIPSLLTHSLALGHMDHNDQGNLFRNLCPYHWATHTSLAANEYWRVVIKIISLWSKGDKVGALYKQLWLVFRLKPPVSKNHHVVNIPLIWYIELRASLTPIWFLRSVNFVEFFAK